MSRRFVVTQKAVLFDGDAVLLLRDAKDGDWEFPGGRVDRGEGAVESVRREVREETGLEPALSGPVFTATARRQKKRGKFFVYYRGEVARREVSLSDEHDDHVWLAAERATGRLNGRRRGALDGAVGAGEA